MINTITFDSQVAMAGALSSIFGHGQKVNESTTAKTNTDNVIVESENAGVDTGSAQGAETVSKSEPVQVQDQNTAGAKGICSEAVAERVKKFHEERKAKKFGKKLKTCCESNPTATVGEDEKKRQKIAGAPVEIKPEEQEDQNVATTVDAGAGAVGEADETANVDSDSASAAGEGETDTSDSGEGDVETDNGDDRNELVAHASAVSERMASLRDKLVAELDADDGLKLDNQKGDDGSEATSSEGQENAEDTSDEEQV